VRNRFAHRHAAQRVCLLLLIRPVRAGAPFSSFFTLLEFYSLQLQHLSLHSITLVAIFIHFYEMYLCVRPSV
jgi:hypothetical protein